MIFIANDEPRMNLVMEKLQKMGESDYSSFIRVLFGLSSPSPVPADLSAEPELDWFDPTLNSSQKEAIKFAMASREVALIHGPPGVSRPRGSNWFECFH